MPPLVLDGTNGVSGVDGTASNPAIEGTDSNTGIFYPAADTVAIGTGGTEALRVNSSQNVGIGTTSPAQTLHVKTSTSSVPITLGVLSNATGLPALSFNGAYASTTMAGIYGNGATASNLYYTVPASQSHFFAIADSTKMTLDASGKLGVGTTSPAATFHAANTDGGGMSGANPSGEVSRIQQTPSAGSGGYVAQRLFLNKTSTANDGISLSFEGLAAGGDRYALANIGGYISSAGTGNAVSGHFAIFTKPANGDLTERARITSGGYFKATSTGTYSGGATSTVHEFDTSVVDGTIVNFYNQAASLPYGIYVQFTAADPNDATRYVFGAQQNTGVFIYRIYSNGTVAARSDVKWKKNIETTRDGYAEDLAKLRVVKYNWYNHDDGTPKELGLIAQEVEQVFPGLVTTDEQTRNEIKTREIPAVLDEEGNEVEPARTEEYTEKVGTGEYSKSIKFSVLPIMLLKAVQEQQAMIQELKAEIAALKGNA